MACDARQRGHGDDGVVIVIIAATIAALLIVVSIVIDLGGARTAKGNDQNAADAAVLAAGAKLNAAGGDNQNACKAAWTSLVSNIDVAASPGPSCITMAGTCNATTAREVVTTSGSYTVTLVNPVPDSYSLFTNQPAETPDAAPCDRFAVIVQHAWRNIIASGNTTLNVSAVARRSKSPGDVDAPLILLDPHACEVLQVSGSSHMTAETATGDPGYIAVDSDGSGCTTGKKVIVDTTGDGQITAGAISMWALTGGNTARAYDPGDVGVDRGFYPAPVASTAPVGRSPIDWTYNCLPANGCPSGNSSAIANLVAAQGSGLPTGFSRWSSLYSCSPSTDLVVPAGNWYIDCAGGVSTSKEIVFRGGNIVADGPFNLNGSGALSVNCNKTTVTATCPNDPGTTSTFFLRNGNLTRNGDVTMRETFVYLANGSIDLGGNTQLDWTAPNDPASPFNNLLVWTESSAAMNINGTPDMSLEGIFFAPNAALTLGGDTGASALESQMFVDQLSLSGNGTLTLAPRSDRSMQLGASSSALIR